MGKDAKQKWESSWEWWSSGDWEQEFNILSDFIVYCVSILEI